MVFHYAEYNAVCVRIGGIYPLWWDDVYLFLRERVRACFDVDFPRTKNPPRKADFFIGQPCFLRIWLRSDIFGIRGTSAMPWTPSNRFTAMIPVNSQPTFTTGFLNSIFCI